MTAADRPAPCARTRPRPAGTPPPPRARCSQGPEVRPRAVDRIAHEMLERPAAAATSSCSASPPAASRSPAGSPRGSQASRAAPSRSARWTSRSTATTCGCSAARALGETDLPAGGIDDKLVVLVDDVLFSGRTVRAALDALRRPRPARAPSSSRCWSTAATGSCRSAPTTSARTSRPRRRRRSTSCSPRTTARDAVLLGPADRRRGEAARVKRAPAVGRRPRPGRRARSGHRRGARAGLAGREVKKLPDAARPHRRQPVLRGLDPHPDLLRAGRQAAVGRRHQLLRQGLERVQGRDAQGHRADAARRWAPTPSSAGTPASGAPQPARRLDPRLASSTPATAPTSTPPRRCSTRSRCAAAWAGIEGRRVAIVGDVLHSRVARCNVLLLPTLGAEVTLVAPPTLLPVGVEAWPAPGLLRPRRGAAPRADAVMMLRVQRERMGAAYFPTAREYSRRYGLDAAASRAARRTRSSCTRAR